MIPGSLRARALIVVVLGLAASHALAFAIYSIDRRAVVDLTEATDMAERIAAVIKFVERVPAPWRDEIVAAADSRRFGVALGAVATTEPRNADNRLARAVDGYIRGKLRDRPDDHLIVAVPTAPGRDAGRASGADWKRPGFVHVTASARLSDGQWLNFRARSPRTEISWFGNAGIYVPLVAVFIVLIVFWLVGRVTAPLTAFARAAERLGKDIGSEPLPVRGPLEVTQAIQAFNDMQESLQRMVETRTRMLAAISHDLRMPVTLLRLRAELLQDEDERKRMLKVVGDMETLIASVLDFTSATFDDEPRRQVDVSALLESLCEDLAETGAEVAFDPPGPTVCLCRLTGIRRALGNIIENAVKYGVRARIRLDPHEDHVTVVVDDDGPGIPEDEMENIFTPYFRLEDTADRDIGGAGLGLGIAQAVIHGHGGTIALRNREEGGLRVEVSLPR